MVKCQLCGEEVPADNMGIGGTLMVVHGNEHDKERKRLKMPIQDYVDFCQKNPHSPVGTKRDKDGVIRDKAGFKIGGYRPWL